MSYRGLVLALVGVITASPALAASATRHSGTIVSVDAAKHTMTLEEMGRWMPRRKALVQRSIELAPSTKFELFTRAKGVGSGGWQGGFEKSSLTASDLRPGDHATVTVERDGRQPKAVSVEVVRLRNG